MGKLLNLQEFKDKEELYAYASAQYIALAGAIKQIDELQNKIKHLEDLLAAKVDNNVETIIKSPELALIEAQILMLVDRAMTRELQLEEVKCLDLLIKNKGLLTNQPTTIPGEVKPKKELSQAQLISLARVVRKDG